MTFVQRTFLLLPSLLVLLASSPAYAYAARSECEESPANRTASRAEPSPSGFAAPSSPTLHEPTRRQGRVLIPAKHSPVGNGLRVRPARTFAHLEAIRPGRYEPLPDAFSPERTLAYLRAVGCTGWSFLTPGLYFFVAVST